MELPQHVFFSSYKREIPLAIGVCQSCNMKCLGLSYGLCTCYLTGFRSFYFANMVPSGKLLGRQLGFRLSLYAILTPGASHIPSYSKTSHLQRSPLLPSYNYQ